MLFTRLLLSTACVASLAALEARATSVLRRSRLRSFVREPTEEVPDEDKTQMDPIEVFRSTMCLGRASLIDHEKCLTWMVRKCLTETSGVGSCDRLEQYLNNLCEKEGKKHACEIAAKLAPKVKEEKEKQEKERKEVEVPAPAPPQKEAAPAPAQEEAAPAPPAPAQEEVAPAPAQEEAVAQKGAPAPAPAKAENEKEDAKAEEVKEEKLELEKPKGKVEKSAAATAGAPAGATGEWPKKVEYSKKIRDLPEHGYDEHSDRDVQYDDDSHASDWQKEWPTTRESKVEVIKKICAKNPDNKWCKRYPFPKKKKEEKSVWKSVFR